MNIIMILRYDTDVFFRMSTFFLYCSDFYIRHYFSVENCICSYRFFFYLTQFFILSIVFLNVRKNYPCKLEQQKIPVKLFVHIRLSFEDNFFFIKTPKNNYTNNFKLLSVICLNIVRCMKITFEIIWSVLS